MNKDELIKAMREAFKEKYNLVDFKTQNIDLDGISECFAEAALTLMSREWVRVEDELPMVTTHDVLHNPPDDYGNTIYKIIKVTNGCQIWHDVVCDHNVWKYEAKEAGITHWLKETLPTPPKQ